MLISGSHNSRVSQDLKLCDNRREEITIAFVQGHLWFEKKGIYGLRKRHLWFEKKAFMV